MRIGVSGAHGTGKTTLVEQLCQALPGHTQVDEPYLLLEEEGYDFSYPPSVEDYRRQLARSVTLLQERGTSLIFDRTPLDFLAYLAAVGMDITAGRLPPRLWPAVASLDLLVIVPRSIHAAELLPPVEMRQLQHAMNDALVEFIYGDPLDLLADVELVEVPVALETRVRTVVRAVGDRAVTRPVAHRHR